MLSPAEVDELASAMKHPLDGTLVGVLAYGGLRIGEAFADPLVGQCQCHTRCSLALHARGRRWRS